VGGVSESALDKVRQWLNGHAIGEGQYDHGDGKWSIRVDREHLQVFSIACSTLCSKTGGSCNECSYMWARRGVKPPLYGHIMHALKQPCWKHLYLDRCSQLQQHVAQLQGRLRSKRARVSATATAATAERQADKQLTAVINSLQAAWPNMPQSKKDRLEDQMRNEGRTGKQKCGRRWNARASRVFARRLAVNSSTKFLHWVDTNISALPTTAACFNKDVSMKIAHWGLQEHALRVCARGQLGALDMRNADLTFSVDEMAINQAITYEKLSKPGEPDLYRVHGFANVCDTAKYGPAETVTVTGYEGLLPLLDRPKANQTFIGLVKAHTYASPVVISYVSLTDGSLVTTDIIRIVHEVEVAAAKLGLKIGNFAADNLGPQHAFSQGISRSFTPAEDIVLLENVLHASVSLDSPALAWLEVAAMHNRTIFQVRNRAQQLQSGVLPLPVDGLVIPISGWPHAFNRSANCLPLCISPEYWHAARLIMETVWKPAKLLILSLARYSSPALASDFQQLYCMHLADLNLNYACVDQADNQNDARAERLGSVAVVQGLAKHVYASRGSQLFSLVLATYFGIFRARLDATAQRPLSVRARLVLCGFVAAFFVYQPLGILTVGKSLKYSLKLNSFTSATRSAVLMHMSGFIAIQLKGSSHFHCAEIVPEVFGEKCNENLHSLLRDPGQQCSAALSPQQLLSRLGEVATQMAEDASGYFESVAGRKEAHKAAIGDLNSPVWSQRVDAQAVHEFVSLGIATCQDLLRQEGYSDVVSKYPTLRQAYAALITLTKPSSKQSHVKWHWMLPPPPSEEVLALETAARPRSAVKLDVQGELSAFFAALSPPQLASFQATQEVPGADGVVAATVPTSSMVGSIIRDASGQAYNMGAVMHSLFNQSKRKQSTAMKQKYAEPDLRDSWDHLMRKPDGVTDLAAAGMSPVAVGQTRVCYFIGPSGQPELAIGLVRSIRASVASITRSGVKKSPKLKFFISTHDHDASASFLCFPYYKWQVGSNIATLCTGETHEYFPVLLHGETDEVAVNAAEHITGGSGSDEDTNGVRIPSVVAHARNQVTCMRFPVAVSLHIVGDALQLDDRDVSMLIDLAGRVQLDVPHLPAQRRDDIVSDETSDGEYESEDSEDDVPLGMLAAVAPLGGRLLPTNSSSSGTSDSDDDVPLRQL
jgi:hypothetical protein